MTDWTTTGDGDTEWTPSPPNVPKPGMQAGQVGDEWDEAGWQVGHDFTPWSRTGEGSTTWDTPTAAGGGAGDPDEPFYDPDEPEDPPIDPPTYPNKAYGACMLWYGLQTERDGSIPMWIEQVIDTNGGTVRFDVYWSLIEIYEPRTTDPDTHTYNWTIPDLMVAETPEDFDIIFTVYCTSRWGVKYLAERQLLQDYLAASFPDIDLEFEPPSSPPLDEDNYTAFLTALVARYKDRVKYWQIENEVFGANDSHAPAYPPINRFWLGEYEEYQDLLTLAAATIRAEDTNAKILLSGYTFGNSGGTPALTTFFADTVEACADDFDILDLHLYMDTRDDDEKIDLVQAGLASLGLDKPIWCTETGVVDIDATRHAAYDGTLWSAEELALQADEIVIRHEQAFAQGIERVLLLRFSPIGRNEGSSSRWTHMSLTRGAPEYQKNEAYDAYKAMLWTDAAR